MVAGAKERQHRARCRPHPARQHERRLRALEQRQAPLHDLRVGRVGVARVAEPLRGPHRLLERHRLHDRRDHGRPGAALGLRWRAVGARLGAVHAPPVQRQRGEPRLRGDGNGGGDDGRAAGHAERARDER
jgi:hypothetical protein